MLILLPPSEGKTPPRRGARVDLDRLSSPVLREPRARVLDALVTLCSGETNKAAEVLGLGPTQRDALAANAALLGAPTARADRVYSGVLYEALDLPSLTGPARARAARWLGVTSALFGLVRPTDRIPAYRLSGEVSLPGVGALAAYWRRWLDPPVRAGAGSGLVLDLRSSTYAAFWRPAPDLAGRVATLRVLHERQGQRQVVSHFNKATKGRIVRGLLEQGKRPRSVGALAGRLSDLGWHVEPGEPTRAGTRLDVVVTDL